MKAVHSQKPTKTTAGKVNLYLKCKRRTFKCFKKCNIYQRVVPQEERLKYFGLHFDKHLTWKNHVTIKHKQLDLKTREIYWLIGKHSHLSLENKRLIYKTVLKPVWTYGIELWGCATKSNIAVIQRYQSKLLRSITSAPWYVSNQTLHSDLRIP